ncbi:MAG TPA: ATP synthase F1 subunit delta [Nitriliruptorales bacterium]|nr:ATP synthase F1 subunit delta [Nitriliruptorales bacterium]
MSATGDGEDRVGAYADAIFEVARGERAVDAVDDELLQVARAVRDNRELHDAMTNHEFPVGRRLDALDRILEAAHPTTRAAMALLVTSGRVRELEEIARRVAERAAAERQRELAEVYVAVPLDEDRRERLRQALEEATGKDLELKVFVDPGVIGGVRAMVGDTVIDGTLARRLEEVRARLDR